MNQEHERYSSRSSSFLTAGRQEGAGGEGLEHEQRETPCLQAVILFSILLPPHYNLEPILAGTLLYMVIKFYNSISRVLSFRYIGLN